MTTISHRLGPVGAGLESAIKSVAPDFDVVEWPAEAEILVTLDSAWDGNETDLGPPTWIHVLGAGVGNFPLGALGERVLTCSKGATAPAIAEFTLGAMLAFEKHIPDVWVTTPPERWGVAQLGGLAHKTLGLVGIGAIGTEIARRALAFDMIVVAHRRSGRPSGIDGVAVAASLHEVLATADHVVVAAPATEETHHLLDADAFAAMKRGVHLVNIARGSLVDEAALIAALDREHVALATVDVVDPEPPPADHPLLAHPRVRVSPHVSWSSPDSLARTWTAFADNVARYRDGTPLNGVVDVTAGY